MRVKYLLKKCLILPFKMLLMRRQNACVSKLYNMDELKQILFLAGVLTVASITVFVVVKSSEKTRYDTTRHAIIPHLDCKSWKINTSEHKTTLITKAACLQYYYLLIVVSSAPGNFEKRNSIRQTWGANSNIDPQWKTFFLIGQTRNTTHSDLLEQEEKNHDDLIRGDYFEGYHKQSFKIEMGFEWAVRYCEFSFLLKADDDVFVNTHYLTRLLQQTSTPKKGLYMGKVQYKAFADRVNGSKHWVSYEEFAGLHYPPFCSGGGFILSHDVVECFVSMFDVKNRFRFDDVYIGLLANKTGVTAVDHKYFIIPGDIIDECYFVPKTLVFHRAAGECLLKQHRMHSKDFYSFNLGSYF